MSLKYVLRLTASERQALTRIAKGRDGRQRPAVWQVERARALLKCDAGPEGAGWTDEAGADALDVAAGTVGRWRRRAVVDGPEAALERPAKAPRSSRLDRAGEAQLLQLVQSTPPAGQTRWTLRVLARELETRGIVSRISYETVRCVLKNELMSGCRVQRGYPPVPEADCVVPREAMGALYSQPCAARYPVIGRDEPPQPRRADQRTP